MGKNSGIVADKIFRTKSGYCHITPEKIILSQDGIIGHLVDEGRNLLVKRGIMLFAITALLLTLEVYYHAQMDMSDQMIFPSIFVVFLVYRFISSFRLSSNPVIERETISKVKFRTAIPVITRAYFEVFFTDEKGKLKKRFIMLPGSLSGGSDETKTALEIMREEKLVD